MLAAEETLPTVNNRTGFKCSVCDLSFDTVHHLVQHTQTPAHMDMIKEQQEFAKENQEENGAEETSDYTGLSSSMHEQNAIDCSDQVSKCYLCNVNFTSPSHANSHFNGKPHKRKKALFDFKLQQPIPSSTGNESIKKSSENVDQPDSQISLPLHTLGSSNTTVSTELTCDICNVPFSSIINAQQHYNSENHKKKALLLHKQKLGEALPTSCDICNCCFSGPESAEAHFKSEKHRKMENKKQKLGEALPTSCVICNCSFSGPESAEAHFKSEKHRKMENKKQNLGEALPTSCVICNCSFSGPESAEAHFKSEKHRKMENKMQNLGEALPTSCDICNCSFSGPESAEAHFKSEKHKKRENKKQKLGEALPTSCDICNCSFNGPESAEAHFKSEKHKKRENKAILEDTESLSLSCDICICTFTSEATNIGKIWHYMRLVMSRPKTQVSAFIMMDRVTRILKTIPETLHKTEKRQCSVLKMKWQLI
ncbi:zinc finger protein 346-like [Mercenaria mercenaria]|uniref:zinc finger protein 346-like n=1 Tax=Mercenaria mercenaria TaxID=6596 RepID=UPI00234F8590|nr:zinc finger protein 346-like [Mercenaria mercenaria]